MEYTRGNDVDTCLRTAIGEFKLKNRQDHVVSNIVEHPRKLLHSSAKNKGYLFGDQVIFSEPLELPLVVDVSTVTTTVTSTGDATFHDFIIPEPTPEQIEEQCTMYTDSVHGEQSDV